MRSDLSPQAGRGTPCSPREAGSNEEAGEIAVTTSPARRRRSRGAVIELRYSGDETCGVRESRGGEQEEADSGMMGLIVPGAVASLVSGVSTASPTTTHIAASISLAATPGLCR
ncbi:hypothetical protein S58_04640 [Bradyrhizobium oligotrophicum S58]|uniref:Uncharacterized protein n=1 Tax=Bradyrhizobium oligotrophicum S58 TaxID=1245469 RepID=M4Z0P9_9BRAD|nr:hypothetical protein S58_04640 [Bradyrhizobium oligotrophicum S58]